MTEPHIVDFTELASMRRSGPPSLATVGVFDGVHRGHRSFLAQLVERARSEGLRSTVVTFTPHPRNVLANETVVPSVSSLTERVEALYACGLDDVVVLRFSPEVAAVRAFDFTSVMKEALGMAGLMVGHDTALGRKREGTPDVLREIGEEQGFWVEEAPALACGARVISSSAIRDVVARGDVVSARDYLGRPFSIEEGEVLGRDDRSLHIRVPQPQLVPQSGAYETRAFTGEQQFASKTIVDRPARQLRIELPFMKELTSLLRIQFLERVEDSRYAREMAAV